jgi:hypothetical protein
MHHHVVAGHHSHIGQTAGSKLQAPSSQRPLISPINALTTIDIPTPETPIVLL